MPDSPSRRAVLAAGAGALAGLAGGYVARPHLDDPGPDPDPVPFAWADTEWPYPDYDAARTRRAPAASAPEGSLRRAWRAPHDEGFVHAPPVASNGRVYEAWTDDRGAVVRALDAATGDPLWTNRPAAGDRQPRVLAPGDGVHYRLDEHPNASLGYLGGVGGERVWGVRDPPQGGWTVGGGRLYYGDAGDGTATAYDARTGTHCWTTDVDDERLVVCSSHPEFGAFAASFGTLYCLDPTDGSTRWRVPVQNHVRSGPAVAGGRAFVSKWGDGMDLLAFDAATGDRLWTYPLSPTRVETEDGAAARWYQVGAVTPDAVLVVERHADPSKGALHAVDAASGERRWRVEPPGDSRTFSKPVVAGRDVYVCVGDDRTALQRRSLADGALLDSRSLPGFDDRPAVADGRVLVDTDEALLAFA